MADLPGSCNTVTRGARQSALPCARSEGWRLWSWDGRAYESLHQQRALGSLDQHDLNSGRGLFLAVAVMPWRQKDGVLMFPTRLHVEYGFRCTTRVLGSGVTWRLLCWTVQAQPKGLSAAEGTVARSA